MNTTAQRLLATLALVIGFAASTQSFAQSGTITFTGRIVAPACTGSVSANPGDASFAVSLNSCANSQALVARTSVSTNGTTGQTAYLSSASASARHSAQGSTIITVTYE